MDNGLTKNEDLNDQKINCSQMGRLDVGVDIGEMRAHWDRNCNFLNHVKSYVDGTNFVSINEAFGNFLESENHGNVTHIDICSSTLKLFQMIAHDVIVQADVQTI